MNEQYPADFIEQLQTDQSIPTTSEVQLVDTIFKKDKNSWAKIFDELKGSIIIGIIFIVFSLPQVDSIIKKFVPATENSIYMLILIKTLLFIIAYYLIKNLYIVNRRVV
jgi:hypothetical protein